MLPEDLAAVKQVRLSDTQPATRATAAEVRAARRAGRPTPTQLRARVRRFNELLREAARGRTDIKVVEPLTSAASWRAAVGPGSGAG